MKNQILKNIFFHYAGAHALAFVWAGLCFALILNKQVAGLFAGAGFVLVSFFVIRGEIKRSGSIKTILGIGHTAFFLLSTVPMIFVRLLNWGIPMTELTIMGLPGPKFHELSSTFFAVLMMLCLVMGRREILKLYRR